MIERVHRYKEKESLFESSGVEKEIASTLDRRVDLPSGGYLVFDYAEAFTVIDVNTGRFVGSRSKNSNQRLEDTITKNNLEAVKEVVRQLRLRDIGGIIVIDFIDMANPKNRASVEDALRAELERDRTKTYVVEISPLGLVEMTRQNVTDGPREILTRKCPTCAGDGIVVSDHTVAMQVERRLRALASPGSRVQAYRVALHPRVLELLAGPGGARLAAIEEATRRRFFLVPAEGHIHTDHFEVVAEGKLVDLQPVSSIAEGSTVEVKLGEVGRYDATSAAGKIDGIDVLVADAAKLVGKKAKVTIGRVLEGQAFATLVTSAEAGDGPITFESEAEKPTRAPARRKQAAAPGEDDGRSLDDEDDEGALEALEPTAHDVDFEDGGAVEETAAETDADGPDALEPEDVERDPAEPAADGAAPAKKRTRRGTRGGRRRRKPAAAGAAAELDAGGEVVADAVDGVEVTDDLPAPEAGEASAPAGNGSAARKPNASGRRRAPRIHVPAEPDTRVAPDVIEAAVAEAVDPGSEGTTPDIEAGPNGAVPDEDGDAPAATKRKTRRGSRGGRNRRKKPAVAAGAEAEPEDGVVVAVVESPGEEAHPGSELPELEVPETLAEAPPADEPSAPGYVPMSEWLDDFDRR